MELSVAKSKLQSIIEDQKRIISEFALKVWADVYCTDVKTFANRPDDDPYAKILCASITMCSSEKDNDQERCGFDIILKLNRKKQIDDDEFDLEIAEFERNISCFISRLRDADNINEFIKAESEREKEDYNMQMDKYNKKIKNTRRICVVLFILFITAIIFSLFSLLLS